MVKKKTNVLNKIVDRTMTRVATPVILTVGVRTLMKKTGVSRAVAKKEMRAAIKRRLSRK